MVRQNATRSYVVGETVHLRSRVSEPGTKTPTDPTSVMLTRLSLDSGAVVASDVPFVRAAEGDYTLSIATTAFVPGTYNVVVTHESGPERVSIVTDSFVLAAAP